MLLRLTWPKLKSRAGDFLLAIMLLRQGASTPKQPSKSTRKSKQKHHAKGGSTTRKNEQKHKTRESKHTRKSKQEHQAKRSKQKHGKLQMNCYPKGCAAPGFVPCQCNTCRPLSKLERTLPQEKLM